jgi:cytidylyltransferase family protein
MRLCGLACAKEATNMIPPLAIIQMRLHSTRLPKKMLLPVNGHALGWFAWDTAVQHFGAHNVVIASPMFDVEELRTGIPRAEFFGWEGTEDDVLGRFHACAHWYRDDPNAVIVRVTPDDYPIDPYRERCTLALLDKWHATVHEPVLRQHIGHLFTPRVEINTQEDLEAVRQIARTAQ